MGELFFVSERDVFAPDKRTVSHLTRGESHPLCCDCDDCLGPGVPLAPGFKTAPSWEARTLDPRTLSDEQLDALERRAS